MVVSLNDDRVMKVGAAHGAGQGIEPIPNVDPRGLTILYTSTRWTEGRSLVGLWTVPVEGGRVQLLMENAGYGVFSPDGATIAYREMGRHLGGTTWPVDFGIWLADADGSHRRALIKGRGTMMAPISWAPTRPAWSPDGRQIATMPLPVPSGAIVTIDVDGRHPYYLESVLDGVDRPLASLVEIGGTPTWADDETLILPRTS
jgi:hypothetical protein